MGLLDGLLGDPNAMAQLQLGAGLLGGGNFGQAMQRGLLGYQGVMDNRANQAYLQSRTQDMQAQANERSTNAAQMLAAIQLQQRKQQALPGIMGQTGRPGTDLVNDALPPELRIGAQPAMPSQSGDVNVQAALAAGYSPDEISKLASLRNVNKTEVARTIKSVGPDGREYEYLIDKYGAQQGGGMPQYRAPLSVGQGDQTTFVDPYSLKPMGSFGINQSADSKASTAVSWANVGLARDRLAWDKAPDDGASALSPAAVENAASRYNMDGTLPPMGMGKSGASGRTQILNRAGETAVGSGTDQRLAQLDAKSSTAALGQLARSQAMNAAFEKTANANADLALGLSKQMDRTGIPLLNAGIQAYRSGTGSPEATQFAAANQTFVSEYAKIMSGGMGNGPVSDAARGKAEKLLTTSMTQAQYAGNVKLLQTEMGNRMKGFVDQADELRARIRGPVVPVAPTAALAGVPGDIAAILQKHGGQ